MDIIFLPIVGYGDAYSISNTGVVMRTSRRTPWKKCPEGAVSRIKPFVPSICKSFINRGGYPQVRIGPTGHQKTVCVHRLVASAFCANPNNLKIVNHIDGNKTNNNFTNLEWVTQKQNVRHSINNGLQKILYGEDSGNSKLTTESVKYIRNSKIPAKLISKELNVSQSLILLVRKFKIWKHVI